MGRSKKSGEPGDDTSQRVARELYLYDSPRDFGPEHAKLSGREGEKCQPLDRL